MRSIARDRRLLGSPIGEGGARVPPVRPFERERERSCPANEPLREAVRSIRLFDVETELRRSVYLERELRDEQVIAPGLRQRVSGGDKRVRIADYLFERFPDLVIGATSGMLLVTEWKPLGLSTEQCARFRVFASSAVSRFAPAGESRAPVPGRRASGQVGIVGEDRDDDDPCTLPRPSRDRRAERKNRIVEMWRDDRDLATTRARYRPLRRGSRHVRIRSAMTASNLEIVCVSGGLVPSLKWVNEGYRERVDSSVENSPLVRAIHTRG